MWYLSTSFVLIGIRNLNMRQVELKNMLIGLQTSRLLPNTWRDAALMPTSFSLPYFSLLNLVDFLSWPTDSWLIFREWRFLQAVTTRAEGCAHQVDVWANCLVRLAWCTYSTYPPQNCTQWQAHLQRVIEAYPPFGSPRHAFDSLTHGSSGLTASCPGRVRACKAHLCWTQRKRPMETWSL